MAFLTRHDLLNKDCLPSNLDTPTLKKALNVLEEMNFDDDERNAYEEHLKWFRFEASALKKHKTEGFIEGEAKGRTEGLIEGEAKGRTEGLIEGEAKGRTEGLIEGEAKGEEKKAKLIAKELLNTGMTLDTISRITGLSIPELEKITTDARI